MRVLITGATGFIGGHLLECLMDSGDEIRVIIRLGEDCSRIERGGIEIFYGDLTDRASLEPAVESVDYVLHCAARTGPWGPEAEYESANVRGLGTLVDVAMAAGVRRIVHVSSVTVHGADVNGVADETAPLRGGPDPYSRSKVAGEQLLRQLISDKGAPVTIVRPGLVYGPRDASSFGRLAARIEHGRMVVIGAGVNHLPLVYVTDVARGIILASAAEQSTGREYILVNDEPVTQRAYLDTIAAELGVRPPARHIPYRLARGAGAVAEATARLLDWTQPPPLTRFGVEVFGGENRFAIDRARSELGFVPQVGLADGVRQAVKWYEATRGSASP